MTTLAKIVRLTCVQCGAHYREGEHLYTCPACGIEGILDVEYDYDVARASMQERGLGSTPADRLGSIWRYIDLLPISGERGLPQLQVGRHADRGRAAARQEGGRRVARDQGRRAPAHRARSRIARRPSAPRRRASSGSRRSRARSTGNAASSLAGFCADAGLRAIIFVPAHAPPAKVAQLRAFGATVLLVEGSYDQAYYLCEDACRVHGWYDRNCAVNPYLVEGKKTCGLEIGEQLAGRSARLGRRRARRRVHDRGDLEGDARDARARRACRGCRASSRCKPRGPRLWRRRGARRTTATRRGTRR